MAFFALNLLFKNTYICGQSARRSRGGGGSAAAEPFRGMLLRSVGNFYRVCCVLEIVSLLHVRLTIQLLRLYICTYHTCTERCKRLEGDPRPFAVALPRECYGGGARIELILYSYISGLFACFYNK